MTIGTCTYVECFVKGKTTVKSVFFFTVEGKNRILYSILTANSPKNLQKKGCHLKNDFCDFFFKLATNCPFRNKRIQSKRSTPPIKIDI